MTLRKMHALLLALCLLFTMTCSAWAAPTRDAQRADVTLSPGLQTLVEMTLGAAVLRGVPCLQAGEAPSQPLVEGVFTLGLYTLSLPYAGEDIWENKASITYEEAAALYATVFTTGQYQKPEAAQCPCITQTEEGLSFELTDLRENPMIGAHIYSTVFDGETLALACDLFTYYGETHATAEGLPEDALTWLCHGEMTLRYAPETPYGYTVTSFALSDTYLDGMLYDWREVENTAYEYSVTLPAILGLAEDAPACMVWQTADGTATLTLAVSDRQDATYSSALMVFNQDAAGLTVTEMPEFGCFSAVGEGVYELHLVPEEINWRYTLTFRFPPERQAEFTLYAEFIRNSLILWGVSNG